MGTFFRKLFFWAESHIPYTNAILYTQFQAQQRGEYGRKSSNMLRRAKTSPLHSVTGCDRLVLTNPTQPSQATGCTQKKRD